MLVKVEHRGWETQVKDCPSLEEIYEDIASGCILSQATLDDKTQAIISDYIGTCNTVTAEDEEWLEANPDQEEVFHDSIFNCNTCGWWYGTEELAEDNECEECHSDH